MDGIFYKNNILKWLIYKYNGLVQERCNFIANALELRLSCTNPLNTSCLFSGKLININDTSMNHQHMICTMWWRSLPLMQHHGIQCGEDHWYVNASHWDDMHNVMRIIGMSIHLRITGMLMHHAGLIYRMWWGYWNVNASHLDDLHNMMMISAMLMHHHGMIYIMWLGLLVHQYITLGWYAQCDEEYWYVNTSHWDDMHSVMRNTDMLMHHTGRTYIIWWGLLVCQCITLEWYAQCD